MKPAALILCLGILFCTWPHRQAKAEDKYLVPLCLGITVCVVGSYCVYTLVKVCKKKFPPPPPATNSVPTTNAIPTNSITASASLSFASVAEADQWLSLIPPSTGSTQIEIEFTTDGANWERLPAVSGSLDDFTVIHSNPPSSAFYRVRVNP